MDVLISLPKLKTHRLLNYTGALKNQVGLIPGCQKVKIHLVSNNVQDLAQAIIDLNLHIKFHLAFMDGVLGMEGNGPTSGKPINSNFIAGSRDLVALDTVCCHVIGIKPSDVLTNLMGEECGLGSSNLNEIVIKGDIKKIGVIPFEVPEFKNDIAKNRLFNKLYFKLRSTMVRPHVIRELCKGCGKCKKVCPTKAIKIGGSLTMRKGCIYCFGCYENCPHGAIKLKCVWFLKQSFKEKLKNFSLDDLI
jgi:ferredoxin